MNIQHKPVFNIERAEEVYSKKDGVRVRHVFSTELPKYGIYADIFYRETPHPVHGNKYFGLYLADAQHGTHELNGNVRIFNADFIEGMKVAMIYANRKWWYSSSRHDYISHGDKIIDGGRDYNRGWGYEIFEIKGGDFERITTFANAV